MTKRDYYEVLEVERSANGTEIKKAYLKLAKKYHPDTNSSDPSAEIKFKEISEAYEALGTPEKKQEYDMTHNNPFFKMMSQQGLNPNCVYDKQSDPLCPIFMIQNIIIVYTHLNS